MVAFPTSPSITPYGTPNPSPCSSLSTSHHPVTESDGPLDPWEAHILHLESLVLRLEPHLTKENPVAVEQIRQLRQDSTSLDKRLGGAWRCAANLQAAHFGGDGYLKVTSLPLGSADRYRDIYPYSYNALSTGRPSSPYINGSRVILGTLRFLLTQGPTDENWVNERPRSPRRETVGDFWHLIQAEWPKWVISLTEARGLSRSPRAEEVQEVDKCAPYWDSTSFELDNASSIHRDDDTSVPNLDNVPDKLKLSSYQVKDSSNQEQHTFNHALYQAWPDQEVPEQRDVEILARLAIRVLDDAVQGEPILIHCSAGVGRTGAFVLALQLLNELRNNRPIYPIRALTHLRMQRWGCVQTPAQWKMVFLLLAKALHLLEEKAKEQASPLDPALRA